MVKKLTTSRKQVFRSVKELGGLGMAARVFLAAGYKIFREGLRSLLLPRKDLRVVGEAKSISEAVSLSAKLKPDLVIVDLPGPDRIDLEATRLLREVNAGVKILAFSTAVDQRSLPRLLLAGIDAYLLKECAFDELMEAIDVVIDNRLYLSPEIVDLVVRDYVDHLPVITSREATVLTERERQVLGLLASGNSTREIAEMLDLGMKTVDTHRKRIMTKLDLHSIAELTKYALQEGLTTLTS